MGNVVCYRFQHSIGTLCLMGNGIPKYISVRKIDKRRKDMWTGKLRIIITFSKEKCFFQDPLCIP